MYTGKLVVSGSEFAITFRGFRTSKMLVRQHVLEDLSKIYVEPREQMEFILYTLRKYRGLQQFRTDIMCGTSNRHDICVRKDTDTLTSTRTHAQHVHTHIFSISTYNYQIQLCEQVVVSQKQFCSSLIICEKMFHVRNDFAQLPRSQFCPCHKLGTALLDSHAF